MPDPKPPRKRKHSRTQEGSWQNDPGRKETNRLNPTRSKSKELGVYQDHPKNKDGENICGARKADHTHCQRPGGWNTDHEGYGKCSFHGGNTPTLSTSAAKYAGADIVNRMTVSHGYGGPLDVTPSEALLGEVRRVAGHVAFLADRIALWEMDTTKPIPAAQREWLELYQAERMLLAKVSKMALDAGVAERKVQLAEQQGVLLVQALNTIFDQLNLTVEQRRLIPQVVPQVLRTMSEPAVVFKKPPTQKHLQGG